ncbi:hypothetical protein ACFLYF_04490, partial [Chloroflexota bacterium]
MKLPILALDDILNREKLKATIIDSVNSHRAQLTELSANIHANPELGLQETKAAAWLTEYLKANGFDIEPAFCGLPTAFTAGYGQG